AAGHLDAALVAAQLGPLPGPVGPAAPLGLGAARIDLAPERSSERTGDARTRAGRERARGDRAESSHRFAWYLRRPILCIDQSAGGESRAPSPGRSATRSSWRAA